MAETIFEDGAEWRADAAQSLHHLDVGVGHRSEQGFMGTRLRVAKAAADGRL